MNAKRTKLSKYIVQGYAYDDNANMPKYMDILFLTEREYQYGWAHYYVLRDYTVIRIKDNKNIKEIKHV
jgi:hypothetical protein